AYNSKKYYIITQGAGFGDNLVTAPITGNETVLDAISLIGGLSQLSSTRIWIARPAPPGAGCEQILPVNYEEITRGAITTTNYQLLPGDRLFIAEDPMMRFDSFVSRLTRPFERMFGFVSLRPATPNRITRLGLGNFYRSLIRIGSTRLSHRLQGPRSMITRQLVCVCVTLSSLMA